MTPRDRQVTFAPHGHILTNIAVWSPDSRRIVYDVRSDPAGERFDGERIETVDIETSEVRVLYQAKNGARCGVATFHPKDNKVVFILGPENPTADWQYGPTHRQGVVVDEANPGIAVALDARDLAPPFTPGALRGGSHVHVFSGDGQWVSFTYEDHILLQYQTDGSEPNLRNVGISVPGEPVRVGKAHPRNHDGSHFSVLATQTTAQPRPGSDEISRAFEESWVGVAGYRRADGAWQKRALAMQGNVVNARGETFAEVFIVDLPEDCTVPNPADGPLEGTVSRRPRPPLGTVQRRLTYTAERQFKGIQGPRHWLRSSPDGTRIAFLLRDDDGVVQLWTVSPNGGPTVQVTSNPWSVSSAFLWSPDGRWITHVMDNCVCVTDVGTGRTTRLAPRVAEAEAPLPQACVFAPDGTKIAYVRPVAGRDGTFNEVFVCPATRS